MEVIPSTQRRANREVLVRFLLFVFDPWPLIFLKVSSKEVPSSRYPPPESSLLLRIFLNSLIINNINLKNPIIHIYFE